MNILVLGVQDEQALLATLRYLCKERMNGAKSRLGGISRDGVQLWVPSLTPGGKYKEMEDCRIFDLSNYPN